ncbi:MAG TPA: PDZ domain-containing protein [Polyangiaceae bacterium]|nr:PDZ domain-containing protein [Polyangiaceae bacterium]
MPPAILICALFASLGARAQPNPANAARPVVVPVPVAAAPAAPPAPAQPAAPASAPAPAASSTAVGSAPSSKPAGKLPAAKSPPEAAVQQLVRLERGGRPIAVGIPLNGDGRIVTALSPLTHGNQIVAHYPEGQMIPVKLSHSDRAWDLALLTPLGGARPAGLKASHDPPPAAGTKLHALGYVRDKQLGPTDVTLKAKGTLRGCDSAQLADVYELSSALKPADVGAPLVNDQGEVVAIIARACSATDKLGCTLAPYAAPVSAVRDFLRGAPPRKDTWLGMDVVAFDAGFARGVRVATVAPEGPAANSGLRAGPAGVGDVVLAVDGKPVATPEAFAEAVENREPGAPARLTVLTEGRYRELLLTASASPNTAALAPARSDRVFSSTPSGSGSEPPAPAPAENLYR